MINYLRIYNDKMIIHGTPKVFGMGVHYTFLDGTWRTNVIDLCHLAPLLFLIIELFINKIKFPKR